MVITTKYDVGDEVWFMDQNSIQCSVISKPCCIQHALLTDFAWELKFETNYGFLMECLLPKSCLESKLFKTKQELIDSL